MRQPAWPHPNRDALVAAAMPLLGEAVYEIKAEVTINVRRVPPDWHGRYVVFTARPDNASADDATIIYVRFGPTPPTAITINSESNTLGDSHTMVAKASAPHLVVPTSQERQRLIPGWAQYIAVLADTNIAVNAYLTAVVIE